MTTRFHLRRMLPLAALGLAAMLGGCVVYPAYPGYGYGYPSPYYGGAYYTGGWGGYYGGGWRR
jgi:hypothetical protein